EQQLGQLAGEFPELAFWANRVGVQTVLDQLYAMRQDTAELGVTLRTTLAELMRPMIRGADPGKVRHELVAEYRRQRDRPIDDGGDIPAEVALPILRTLYVNPSYRMQAYRTWKQASLPKWINEIAWRGTRYDDLWAMVVGHLISIDAAEAPLVLLGQPG